MRIFKRLVRTNQEILQELQEKGHKIYKNSNYWNYILGYLVLIIVFLLPIAFWVILAYSMKTGH